MSERPFVTARRAAELLGVPEVVVVADIERGYQKLDSLRGGQFGTTWVAYSDEFEGDRLERHRARLSDRENDGA